MGAASELGVDRYALRSIEKRLCAGLQTACAAETTAAQRFNELLDQVPTGIPNPRDSMDLSQAGDECRRARENYRAALQRFTDFLVHGIMPDDLRD